MEILIRPETPADHSAIHDVTQRAFAPSRRCPIPMAMSSY
jgi:predicted N-acetyltransferase YhbS